MKANCLFCYLLDIKQRGWPPSLGYCRDKMTQIRTHQRSCNSFSQIGPHYMQYVDWVKEEAKRYEKIHKMMMDEHEEWFSLDTHETRSQEETQ